MSALSEDSAVETAPHEHDQTGHWTWLLGDFKVTTLNDGSLEVPVEQYLDGPKPGEVEAAFKAASSELPMEMSDNAFLIDTGEKVILVDAGGGNLYGPTLGHLQENLAAAGYRPEQVDLVLLTHLHGDHSGGLIVDDKKVFPNAEVYASQADFDYFLDPDNGAESEGLEAVNFSAAKKTFSIYEDRIESFEAPAQIMPGIRAIPAPGHSPGHTVFMVESEGQKLLLMGDLVHVPQMQFAHPEYSMEFDLNEDQGEVTRKTLLDDAAEQHFWVAGAHLPFPATGHIQSKGTGFVYLPAESAASKP